MGCLARIDNGIHRRDRCLEPDVNTTLFSQLQAFLAVARARSFSGAARELGVSRSAVSQNVRQLEEELRVTLVARTTRSVSLTEAGRRLLESAGPAVAQVHTALSEVTAQPGEVVGRVRLTVPRSAFHFVIAPVLPKFRERHPRVEVDLVFEDRRVDIVGEGYDAGIRLSEYVERDMVSIRLTDPFRFIVVGAPDYLDKHGTPERPEDLLRHECLTFRSESTGALYAWELERGRRTWRIPVRGSVVVNDGLFCATWAEQGLGLAYVMEPLVSEPLRKGALRPVLEPYATTVPGFFLYYPSRAQSSAPLRLFVETVRELTTKPAATRKRPRL
jgi:DNA-binding transcriptional LysR family regulator